MKGFKVVQCIKIDSFYIHVYALFMTAVCPKDQEKLSLVM